MVNINKKDDKTMSQKIFAIGDQQNFLVSPWKFLN